MNVNIKIKNTAEIRAAFLFAPQAMKREMDRALKKSAFQLQRQSQINTPVLTGRLRASHQTTYGPGWAKISPTANYAIFVHEGTRYMPGRPFLEEAVESETQQIDDYFTEAVKNVFDGIGRRA